jgi:hypothetical protein
VFPFRYQGVDNPDAFAVGVWATDGVTLSGNSVLLADGGPAVDPFQLTSCVAVVSNGNVCKFANGWCSECLCGGGVSLPLPAE